MTMRKIYFKRENWTGPSGFLLTFLVCVGALFMANDILAIRCGLLRAVGIEPPFLVRWSLGIAFALSLVVWFAICRKSLFIAGLSALVICIASAPWITASTDRLVERIPVSRSLESDQFDALQKHFPFAITESGDAIYIAKNDAHAAQVKAALIRMGMYARPSNP